MKEIQHQIILHSRTEELALEEGHTLSQQEERRKQEEILWKQKSRVNWLKEGDRNTNFFHKAMLQRHQHNRIFSLKATNGEHLIKHEGMERELVTHFKDLLTKPLPNRQAAIQNITTHIPRVITQEQNLAQLREVTLQEVE